MGRSRMLGAAMLGGWLLVFVVDSTGTGQAPPQGSPLEKATSAAKSPPVVTPMAVADGMLGFASPDAAGGQMVTLIDSRHSWMAVYAVDAKGQIRLLSSRPLQQDFSVQYNVMDPTPAEIGRLKPR
ncbi:hypothetical protein [Candidatus Laterigemmans baculatus]|uniref:hypothetical protein n=1 Tax=Candidatus Laterigemmans baculatus TaxID=2770505 RepID=UPI0013DA59B9|nr:hypothetical protein [Candidatus Laterigemmans baculatus]